MARTSRGMWPADCAASTTVTTPALRARAHSSATGLTVPRVFEMCVNAKSLTSGVSSPSRRERSSSPPSPVTGTYRSVAPVRCAASCQGTRLLWCSISVSRITSPGRRWAPPQLAATRLTDSVVPRVNTISAGSAAFRYRASRERAPS